MQTQADYQVLAQVKVDELVPLFASMEATVQALVDLAEEFDEKACNGTIEGEVTLKSNKILRLTERFQDRLEATHAFGAKPCAAAGLNEGK